MLDEFKQIEPQTYNILNNAIKKNKVSHAYIIETNSISRGTKLALSFAKAILCPLSYTNNQNCRNCNQCKIIDTDNFPELTIIEPEGLMIKKNQLMELQNEFSKKSIYGKAKIYIIKHAEQMNQHSANSILKFLEEPPENVVAILLTDNKEKLLKTIVSRCQLIILKSQNVSNFEQNTIEKLKTLIYSECTEERNDIKQQINTIIKFIIYYEYNHQKTMINMNNIFCEQISDKEKLNRAFDVIIAFYKDIFNLKLNRSVEIFKDYQKELEEISKTNTMLQIINKINTAEDYQNHLKFNVNIKLLIDGLIIALEEVKS